MYRMCHPLFRMKERAASSHSAPMRPAMYGVLPHLSFQSYLPASWGRVLRSLFSRGDFFSFVDSSVTSENSIYRIICDVGLGFENQILLSGENYSLNRIIKNTSNCL
jgi:hypothetical protein